MDCFVYVLGCLTGNGPMTYVGWTNNLEARVEKHNSGRGAKSTRGKAWSLLYVERYGSKGEAMSREYALKKDRKFRAHLKATCL
ncbi:MAG: GIY-YIG nuclease family protein [Hyphomonadaceae bacterium]